jgi:hypothetical protein
MPEEAKILHGAMSGTRHCANRALVAAPPLAL